MNNKGLNTTLKVGIITIIIVVVLVAGVIAFLPGNDDETADIASATSLQFATIETTNEHTETTDWYVKNIGTNNLKLRMELTRDQEEWGVIINGELKKIWELKDGQWTEVTLPDEGYTNTFDLYASLAEEFRTEIAERGESGEWTEYDQETGANFRAYNIKVNSDIADSLFAIA